MRFQATAAASEDSANYVRLKAGDTVKGVFRGDLFEFKKHWVGNHTEFCAGDAASCPLCLADPSKKAQFRFRVNLVINEGGALIPKIFEQGWLVYCQLRDIHTDFNLEKTVVKITRTGSGLQDTTYSVLPVPGGDVKPDFEKRLSEVKLLDLMPSEALAAKPHDEHANEGMFTDDIPF
jgi:hypothetical protein